MHGKQFLLESIHAGIDEKNLYGRLNFAQEPEGDFEIRVNVGIKAASDDQSAGSLTLDVSVHDFAVASWRLHGPDEQIILSDSTSQQSDVVVALRQYFAFKLPLSYLQRSAGTALATQLTGATIRLRFALWQDRLPLDALPLEDWIELPIAAEDELMAGMQVYSTSS
jgi:hypothetical protein